MLYARLDAFEGPSVLYDKHLRSGLGGQSERRPPLALPQLLLVAVLAAVANVFFSTASATFVPEILERADFAEGNARLELSTSTAMFAGPTA